MSPTRREFLKGLGIALASLVMAGCAPFKEGEKSARRSLRDCWLRLDWLAEQRQQSYEQGEQAKEELITEYRAALDSLAASGTLDEEVAYHIQYAFAAAADHILDSIAEAEAEVARAASSCYIVLPPTPTPAVPPAPTPTPTVKKAAERKVADRSSDSAARLVQQADLLAEMAGQSGIDAGTVEHAQQAIQRDLFLLSSTPAEREALAGRLVEMAGGTYNLPPFEEWDPALPPDVAEAARFLVELLLEKSE